MALEQVLEDPRVAQFSGPGDIGHGAPPGATFCGDCGLIVGNDRLELHKKWHNQFEVLRSILEARKSGGSVRDIVTCKECGGKLHLAHVRFYSGQTEHRELTVGYWCAKCSRFIPLTQKVGV